MRSKKVQSSNLASNSCSELCFNHPTNQDALRNMHKYPKTSKHTINYSHQELPDHFTLQPGGTYTPSNYPLLYPAGLSWPLHHYYPPIHTHGATPPRCLIHLELLTPTEVGQWVYSSLARLQTRWHTPCLKWGQASLSSPLHCKYFRYQNENQTLNLARAQMAKKDRNVSPGNVQTRDTCEKSGM